jgi:hypothetical protein
MPRPAYAKTLKRTRQELDRLRAERAALDARIAKLEQVEAALRTVTNPAYGPPDLSSLTNVVRHVLKAAITPLTPPNVRDKMVALGFDRGPYSQFLASIHVVLKRLGKNGEVLEFTFKDGKRYWWATKPMPGGPYPENAMLGNYYRSLRPQDLTSTLTYEESADKEAAKYRR